MPLKFKLIKKKSVEESNSSRVQLHRNACVPVICVIYKYEF